MTFYFSVITRGEVTFYVSVVTRGEVLRQCHNRFSLFLIIVVHIIIIIINM